MRFSSRLQWNSQRNAISEAVAAKRRSGVELLDLTVSNPTQVGLAYPEPEILEAIASADSLSYRPEAAGLLAAREAVASYYGNLSPESILITSSTSEAYSYLFKLLCDPGDEILVPRPSYPLFEMLAGLDGVCPRQYSLHYDGRWSIDFSQLEDLVSLRARAVVVVNPNNPTGNYLREQEYLQLAEFCSKHDLALICDEVFADYPIGKSPGAVPTIAGRSDVLTFVLSGLSKVSALPQMKLGWIVTSGPPAEAAISRLELIADAYLSPGSPAQLATSRLLELRHGIQAQIRKRIAVNFAAGQAVLQDSSFRLLQIEGGWTAIVRAPEIRAEEEWVVGLLQHENVLVQPGYFYDFESEAYLILSLITPEAIFYKGITKLGKGMS